MRARGGLTAANDTQLPDGLGEQAPTHCWSSPRVSIEAHEPLRWPSTTTFASNSLRPCLGNGPCSSTEPGWNSSEEAELLL